ncbi:MAG: hypothetical protein WC781_02200 [Candidatus Pacearchaeota archaeon]|jgi:hypothetical protein
MTRKIHIRKPKHSNLHLVYDGDPIDRNRREYCSFEDLIEKFPYKLKGYTRDHKAVIYFHDYSPDETKKLKSEIIQRHYFKRVNFE